MASASASDIVAAVKAKWAAEIDKAQSELDNLRQFLNARTEPVEVTRTKRATRHTRKRRQPKERKRAKQPNSSSSRSEAIISGVGHSLHVNDLIEKIQSKYGEKVAKQTLVSSLSRLAKTGDRFVRTAPNTFGLIGMERDSK